jgi:hypothetical protein
VVPLKDGVLVSIFVDVLGVIQGQVVCDRVPPNVGASIFFFTISEQIHASHVVVWGTIAVRNGTSIAAVSVAPATLFFFEIDFPSDVSPGYCNLLYRWHMV